MICLVLFPTCICLALSAQIPLFSHSYKTSISFMSHALHPNTPPLAYPPYLFVKFKFVYLRPSHPSHSYTAILFAFYGSVSPSYRCLNLPLTCLSRYLCDSPCTIYMLGNFLRDQKMYTYPQLHFACDCNNLTFALPATALSNEFHLKSSKRKMKGRL